MDLDESEFAAANRDAHAVIAEMKIGCHAVQELRQFMDDPAI